MTMRKFFANRSMVLLRMECNPPEQHICAVSPVYQKRMLGQKYMFRSD